MPRRDSYYERRAEDRYYDYIYDNCLCEYYEDENGQWQLDEEHPCTHCRWEQKQAEKRVAEEAERQRLEQERLAREAAHPHAREIATIRKWLSANEEGGREGNLGKQLDATRALFTELLGMPTFLKKYPKFRIAMANKVSELRTKEQAAPLEELFQHVDDFLYKLSLEDDYVP